MTDNEREKLRILTVQVHDREMKLVCLQMRNTYPMTHLDLIDHRAAIYEAEIELWAAQRRLRTFQMDLAHGYGG